MIVAVIERINISGPAKEIDLLRDRQNHYASLAESDQGNQQSQGKISLECIADL